MLRVNTTSALASTAGVRSALLRLPSIATEARDRLCSKRLIHELLILGGEFLDLGLVFVDICSLLGDYWSQTGEHCTHLVEILCQFALFFSHLVLSVWVRLDSHRAIVFHGKVCHETIVHRWLSSVWLLLLLLVVIG